MSDESVVDMIPEAEQVEKLPDHYDGVRWPGKIAMAGEIRGHYAGCKLQGFQSAQEVNEFFENTPHIIAVDIFPTATTINVLYTTALSADELDDIAAWGHDQRAFMIERQNERELAKREAAKAEILEKAEQRRLAELGKKHEQNCGKGDKKQASKKGK